MKKLFFGFASIWVATFSTAHEIKKELEVIRIWRSPTFHKELHWMIADTIRDDEHRYIYCAGFDANGVPLFSKLMPAAPFATEGTTFADGWDIVQVVQVRCAYS